MKKENSITTMLPVFFGFFIMGFCDVVGITSMHVKLDLLGNFSPEFRDTLSNLIPVALFSMFLIFSVPTIILKNKNYEKTLYNRHNLYGTVVLV